jgi:CheY-like chemotaxis protein
MSIRVLVVDDTEHVCRMLAEMLTLDGFTVVGTAPSGADALRDSLIEKPDVVIMDYKMPEIDGLTAARAIRAALPDQAIILYTAYMSPSVAEAARAAGIALCVGKHEGLQQLERHITEICRDLRIAPNG